jgi:DNA-binding winged helix-turn-helix (wHTH) protein/TolB-like protein/Flp pilus assembly protein TadD
MSTANHFRPTAVRSECQPSYRFGPFVLDTLQHELLKQGKPVPLTPKTYDTLLVLVQNNGRMVSKDELMKILWPDSFVEESNLTQQVSMIRKALGESGSNSRYIVTIAGRGYRFNDEVERAEPDEERAAPNTGPQLLDFDGRSSKQVVESIPQPPPPERSTSNRWIIFVTAACVLLIALALAITKFPNLTKPKIAQPVKPRSLAILPLQNLKPGPSSDFLGFSLADAVITKLDYVSSLTVRPSAAVEKYRDKSIDIASVGADLKVDTLLAGSFIREGDNLRISYQLIDVKTQNILGRGMMDLKYDDLLRVQDTVAAQIIQKLELSLSASETQRIKSEAVINPLAYEYYLRGVDFHSQHQFPLAIKMLEKSTEIDPTYSLSWGYLGASYTSDAAFELGGQEQYRRAQAAYERALAIDPSQLDARMFLANLLVDTGKVEQAVPLLRDALKANANYAPVHWELGYAYRFTGMLNESVAECELAREIDPLVKSNGSVLNTYLYLGQYDKFLASLPDVSDSSFILFYRGFGEYYEKDLERASKAFDRAYEIEPTLYTTIGKAFSESIAHRNAAGLEILRALEGKMTERGVGDPEAVYKIAQAYAVLGDKASAIRTLRHSVETGFFSYPYIATDPLFNGIRSETEFGQILTTARKRHEAFKTSFLLNLAIGSSSHNHM